MTSPVVQRAPDLLSRRLPGELHVVDAGGAVRVLSGPALSIWDLLDGERDIGGIGTALGRGYRTSPGVVDRDVRRLLRELQDRGLAVAVAWSEG